MQFTSRDIVQIGPSSRVANSVKFQGKGSVIISAFCTIEEYVLFDTGDIPESFIIVGPRSKIKQGAILRTYNGNIRIGTRSSIGEYSVLSGLGGLTIGDAVIIAGHCYFSAADHIFASDIHVRFQGETARGICIGSGAWLGANCVVLDNVHVGDGCIIGASSVITRSMSKNTICYGSPCKENCMRMENG